MNGDLFDPKELEATAHGRPDRFTPVQDDGMSAPGPARRGREYGKSVRRERIKAAARELFSQLDYEKATLRMIATRAGVALGTLSLYAQDKRDLILLAYNDEVQAMIASGVETFDPDASFDANLLSFFRAFYEGYATNLQLARTYLDINFFAYGMNAADLARNRQRKMDAVRRIVCLGQSRGELRSDVKDAVVAMQFLFLHSSAVRSWILLEQPAVRDGLVEMRKLIELQIQGFSPVQRTRQNGEAVEGIVSDHSAGSTPRAAGGSAQLD